MHQLIRTWLWMGMGRALPVMFMIVAMFIATASAVGAEASIEVRSTRAEQDPPESFAVTGWVTELIGGNRIGTSIPSAQLLRRKVGELDSVKVRINGKTFNARLMSEAVYEKVVDNPLLWEMLKADVICLVKKPGPLSHVELIVPQGEASLKARQQMPVRMELAIN